MRERLKAKPDAIVCKYLFEPAILEDSKRSFGNMLEVNLAHVLMLLKQGIIEKTVAQELVRALLEMYNSGPGVLELNPSYEDYYFNIEQYIISQTGPETGGKLHTARSRNDLHE